MRDESGQFKWMEVPRSPNGVGAFGEKKVYVPANTIVNCDFLITVPVMKVHNMCGITASLKNYVGTAPRIVYANKGNFSNNDLHSKHSLEGRIDSFITDLAAFHPPDYCVVDGIRGLQYSEHRIDRPGQEVRSNLILAGEDPVATDALVADIMGYQPSDIEFLHMASQRQMGTMDLRNVEVAGDEPDQVRRRWGKPTNWCWALQSPVAAYAGCRGRHQGLGALHLAHGHAPLCPMAASFLLHGHLQVCRAGAGRRDPQGFPVGGRARAGHGVPERREGDGRRRSDALPRRAVPGIPSSCVRARTCWCLN